MFGLRALVVVHWFFSAQVEVALTQILLHWGKELSMSDQGIVSRVE